MSAVCFSTVFGVIPSSMLGRMRTTNSYLYATKENTFVCGRAELSSDW